MMLPRFPQTILCVLMLPTCSADATIPTLPRAWLAHDAPGSTTSGFPQVVNGRDMWWRIFADQILDRLEDRALVGNHDLGASLAIARRARAEAGIAGAPLLPSLSVGATYGRGTQAGTRNRGIELSGGFLPDLFGGNHAGARAAGRRAEAAEDDARMAALNLTALVAGTYFELVALRERIELARKISADADRLLHLIEAQQGLGSVSRLEVEQQRNAAAMFAAAIPELQRLAEADAHILSTLTGEAPADLALASVRLGALPLPVEHLPLPAELVARRADVAAAERRLEAARFDVKAARAALFPRLSIALDGGVGADAAASLTPAGLIGGVLAGLVQPIFQGGALRGRVHANRAQLEAMAELYWQTLVDALRSIEDGLTDQAQLGAYERKVDEAVDSARQAQRLAEARVSLGSADYTTLLLTQRALYQAEDSRLQIRQQRLTVLARLRAASSSGEGLMPISSRTLSDGGASSR